MQDYILSKYGSSLSLNYDHQANESYRKNLQADSELAEEPMHRDDHSNLAVLTQRFARAIEVYK